MDYEVEKQEVEKAKEVYKQKVAILRAVIAVHSDKDEYDNFEEEFERAADNRMDAHEGDYRDDYHLDDEEEVLKWVLDSRARDAADAAGA